MSEGGVGVSEAVMEGGGHLAIGGEAVWEERVVNGEDSKVVVSRVDRVENINNGVLSKGDILFTESMVNRR